MDLFTLLIFIVVVGLLCYAVNLLPMAQAFKNIAVSIVILIAVLSVLREFGIHLGSRLH